MAKSATPGIENRLDVNLLKQKDSSKKVYDILLNRKIKDQELWEYACRWYTKLELDIGIDERQLVNYEKLFRNIKKTTKIVKFGDFQYRLLLGKIFTNDTLYRWKIKDKNECEYCNEKQTAVHLFVHCTVAKSIWARLSNFLMVENSIWNDQNIMENLVHQKPTHIINFIVLVVKQYIYRCKCQENIPNYTQAMNEIYMQYKMDKYNATADCQTECHNKTWGPVKEKLSLLPFP